MKVVTMTRELAMAAARDAGNRHMRAAGRCAWSESDLDAACAELDRLWPLRWELASQVARESAGVFDEEG